MEAVRAALICASAALVCSLIPRPEMRLGVVIAAGLCVMAFCLQPLREGAAMLRTLGAQSGADTGGVMIRAVGVAIVAEFGAQLCRDAGEGALAVHDVGVGENVAAMPRTHPRGEEVEA